MDKEVVLLKKISLDRWNRFLRIAAVREDPTQRNATQRNATQLVLKRCQRDRIGLKGSNNDAMTTTKETTQESKVRSILDRVGWRFAWIVSWQRTKLLGKARSTAHGLPPTKFYFERRYWPRWRTIELIQSTARIHLVSDSLDLALISDEWSKRRRNAEIYYPERIRLP